MWYADRLIMDYGSISSLIIIFWKLCAIMKSSSLGLLTSTLMGKDQNKKIQQLVQALLDNPDTHEFRKPVDWKSFGLVDYPTIVQKPMDISTVRSKLAGNCYNVVEDCLDDIQLIWDNCKLYNAKDTWIHKLADKLEKTFKKMIKNYLPFILAQKKEKIEKKKEEKPKVMSVPEPTAKLTVQPEPEQLPPPVIETEEERLIYRPRRVFLDRAALCTPQQTGILFLLIRNNKPEAISIQHGRARIETEQIDDRLLSRLQSQLDMWGIGLEPIGKKR